MATYTLRSQGATLKGPNNRNLVFSEERSNEAEQYAQKYCLETGKEVAIVRHEKDSSNLIKKVFLVNKAK